MGHHCLGVEPMGVFTALVRATVAFLSVCVCLGVLWLIVMVVIAWLGTHQPDPCPC
jgi:hypothetical protein